MTQRRSRRPILSDTISGPNDDDSDQNHWYHPRSSSPPPSSLSVNQSFTPRSSSTTMGSWGFDVNRSSNGQTPLPFTLNNNNNNNNNTDQHTNTRLTKDYNERLVERSLSPQTLKPRTPTLTRHRRGNEFASVDRLVLGPNRMEPPNDSSQQEQPMTSNHPRRTQTDQELLAWQNRMLQRDQQFGSQSPQLISRRNFNSSQSSSRQIRNSSDAYSTPIPAAVVSLLATSTRPVSAMSNMSESQQFEHDHHESTIKSARVIKRYIELLYHLQSFYERLTDQLVNGNSLLKTNQSIFTNHCRKITEQLQNCKPIWEEKLANLQHLLKDITSRQWSGIKTETTFLQRQSTLQNLLQTLNAQKDLDRTHTSIRADIDRVLHEDKLAVQLQDELSTLLQHQSLLNDFTSLLQWNHPIYSSSEQTRVETVLPLLREQITTTDSYIAHVSQQLTELVTSLRSLEKYILSYTNTIPLIDDEIVPSPQLPSTRDRWRPYNETDIDPLRPKELHLQHHRNENSHIDSHKTRSASMPRYIDSEEFNRAFIEDDLRTSTKNNPSTRMATIKSARRDNRTEQLNSILKPYPPVRSSNGRRNDSELDTIDRSSSHLVDFDHDDQIMTVNDRLGAPKKKEVARGVILKQHKQNEDFSDEDDDIRLPFNEQNFEETLNIQSVLAKEKSRQAAAKHHLTNQRRPTYHNA